MESSILISTKKIIGIPNEYEVYDLDILTFINEAFAVLYQIGVGPPDIDEPFFVEDADAEWEDFDVPPEQLSVVRTYVPLKAKLMFDPPTVGFLKDAAERQIEQFEWRLNVFRESKYDKEIYDKDYIPPEEVTSGSID